MTDIILEQLHLRSAGNYLAEICHVASHTAGWWNDPKTGMDLRQEARDGTRFGKALVAEKLVLIHSEVSEAWKVRGRACLMTSCPTAR